jgi:S-adenosylmethionine synthetase
MVERLSLLRTSGDLPWLRPWARVAVEVVYRHGEPVGIRDVVVETQHDPEIGDKEVHDAVMDLVIRPDLPQGLGVPDRGYFVNARGRLALAGLRDGAGVSGRLASSGLPGDFILRVDSGLSGITPGDVRRSAGYLARCLAKNIVAAKLARRCAVWLRYETGHADIQALHLDTFGTGRIRDVELARALVQGIDLRVGAVHRVLDLRRPIFAESTRRGLAWQGGDETPWERIRPEVMAPVLEAL